MKSKKSFVVKLQRPVCRTPIKYVQKHKNDVKYSRRDKNLRNFTKIVIGDE
jgi:hypothetical protein